MHSWFKLIAVGTFDVHANVFFDCGTQVCGFNIHLMDLPPHFARDSEHYSHGNYVGNAGKGFVIVMARTLAETLDDPADLPFSDSA